MNTLFETASNYINPKIYDRTKDMPLTFLVGVIVTGFCMVASIIWLLLEKFGGWGSLKTGKDSDIEVQKRKLAGIVDERRVTQLVRLGMCDRIKAWWTDLKDPMVALNVAMTSIAQYNFYQIMTYVTECMVIRFGLKLHEANHFVAISLFLTIPSSQIYSYLAVGFGRKPMMLILSSIFLVVFLLLFLMLPKNTNQNVFYLTSFLFSQFFSISTAIGFSCIGIVTPPRTVSVAYSLVSFNSNFAFCILPFIVGMFLEENSPEGYQNANLMVLGFSLVGLGMAIGVKVIDMKRGGILALPEKKKEAKASERDYEGDAYTLRDDADATTFDDGRTMSLQPPLTKMDKLDN